MPHKDSEFFNLVAFQKEFSRVATTQNFVEHQLVSLEAGDVLAWERVAAGDLIYISAGIHGDEPAGPLALLALLKSGILPNDKHLVLCPTLNPYGLIHGSRKNSKGLDLNRDYLLKSSMEVAAHTAWLEQRACPSLFISLHEDWETEGFYFYEINLGLDDEPRAQRILAAVGSYISAEEGDEIDGHKVRSKAWIYHQAEADLPESWPEAIWLAKRGCGLSFTFETPSQAELELRISAHIAAVETVLK